MNGRSIMGLAIIMGAALSTAPVSAQESPESLVAEALQNNPEIQFYQLEMSAVRASTRNDGALPDPVVSGSVGRIASRNPGPNQPLFEGMTWSVGVMQNFEWPGRRNLRKAIADGQVELAETGLHAFEAALAARVRGEAWKLAAAQRKADVAREVADRYRALRETLIQRDLAGITPKLELRILEATEISLRQRAIDASLKAKESGEQLNFLLGRPQGNDIEVALEMNELSPAPSLDSLLASARKNNFDIRLNEAHIRQQGFRVELAENEGRPSISVGPEVARENGSSRDTFFSMGVSISLPLWRRNSHDVEAARIREHQARTLLELAVREAGREVTLAASSYHMHLDEMANWSPEVVENFRDAADLADRHYRLGAVNASTYIEMQKQYLEAVESWLDARYEAVQSASLLEELTGVRLLQNP